MAIPITAIRTSQGHTSTGICEGPPPDGGSASHVAVRDLGLSIETNTRLEAFVTSPVHPLKTYVVSPMVTRSSTETVAVRPAAYQPAPVGAPCSLATVSSYSVRHSAVTVFGPSITIAAEGAAAVESPDQPANRYRVPGVPATTASTENGATTVALN